MESDMSERRMDAYYYDFESTKNAAIDKILGAVACAGKAYHHTQDWCDETSPYDDHTGKTPTEWIQNAAIEAADALAAMQAQRDAAQARIALLEEALRGVVAVADRDAPEFRAARAALAKGEASPPEPSKP